MKWLRDLLDFIKNVAHDPRIPERDKKVILVILALIVSPIDLIPDWIPVIGLLDDVVMIAIILDYFFNHLDQVILLSHYPRGMKSYVRIRRVARMIAVLTPRWIRDKIWKFKPSVYGP